MNVLPLSTRVEIIAQLVEGISLRAVSRTTETNRATVGKLALTVGQGCARLHDRLVRDVCPSALELDEIWTFITKKQARVREIDPPEWGDQYTFVGFATASRLAVSYLVGKRTAASTVVFINDLRRRVLGKPHISTDGFSAYRDAIEDAFGTQVAYGQAIKVYAREPEDEAQRRYSPMRVIGIEKRVVLGAADPDTICTNHVERGNLTMRMGMRRFTRLTNAFSKRLPNLCAAVDLHFLHYNFCRIHQTLRVTPAMAEGLETRVWSIEELVERALDAAAEPEPTPPSSTSAPGTPPPPETPLIDLALDGRAVVRRGTVFRVIDGGAS